MGTDTPKLTPTPMQQSATTPPLAKSPAAEVHPAKDAVPAQAQMGDDPTKSGVATAKPGIA